MKRKNVLFIIFNLLFQKKFIVTTTNSPTKEIMSTPHATFAATLCHQISTKTKQADSLKLENIATQSIFLEDTHCYSFSELAALKDDILSKTISRLSSIIEEVVIKQDAEILSLFRNGKHS